jgi:hypothetical protein
MEIVLKEHNHFQAYGKHKEIHENFAPHILIKANGFPGRTSIIYF